MDNAEIEALGHRQQAVDKIGRGFGFILLAPLVFFMSIAMTALIDSIVPFLIGLLAATTSGMTGAVCVIQGIVQHVHASAELRRLGQRLPEARLLR